MTDYTPWPIDRQLIFMSPLDDEKNPTVISGSQAMSFLNWLSDQWLQSEEWPRSAGAEDAEKCPICGRGV